MPSILSTVVPLFLRVTRARRTFASAAAAEQRITERLRSPQSHQPPRLRDDVRVVAGTSNGWPVYTVTPIAATPTAATPRGCVIYLHGGAWVNEIVRQHWQLVAQIAAESQTTVIVPIYPLVPEGTALATTTVVMALAREARAQHGTLALAGDSAGGQIAFSVAAALRDELGIIADLTVLISPAVDPSMSNPEMDAVQPRDPWLAKPGNRVFIDAWRGDLSVHDARVNAIEADPAGLGPMLIFSGTRDILNPDTRLLVAQARAAGVEIEYHEGSGLVHVYPLTPTREGRESRALIVDRLRDALTR